MPSYHWIWKSLLGISFLSGSVLLPPCNVAWAGGFSYAPESNPVNPAGSQGASGLENASGIFYNPAALMLLDSQVVFRSDLAIVNPNFNDKGSELMPGFPLTGEGANGRSESIIPSFAAAYRISDDVAVGVSVEMPFGLATLYPSDWTGRYQAIESRLSTLNINPAVAAQVTDELAIGVGVNVQYATGVFSNAIDFGSLIALGGVPPAPQQLDGLVEISGDDWSWGWNVGILYEPTDTTRIGLAYRSAISHTLQGNADFTVPDPAAGLTATGLFTDTGGSSNLDLPDILSLGITQQISSEFTMAAQVDWQNWSRYSETIVKFDNPAQPDIVEPQNWNDTFRFAVGAIYDPSEEWRLRLGVAYDPSPVDFEFQTPRIPSSDAISLDLGVTYQPHDNLGITARWNHLFFTRRDINRTVPGAGTLIGEFDTDIDVFSLMVDWRF